MPKALTDEELAALEVGDDDTPEELEAVAEEATEADDDGEIDDDTDEPEPEPEPQRAQQTVPYDRFQQQIEENERLRNTLNQLTQVVQANRPAPAAAPAKPSYVRPDDPADKRAWREFVGETVDPVVNARLAEIEQQNKQYALAISESLDDQKARAQFGDYSDYEADINTLRQNFYASSGVAVPREYAYYVAKSMRQQKAQANKQRGKVVKRATAAASDGSKPPAKPSIRRAEPVTADRVKKMSLKEMEEYLAKKGARI